MPQAVPLNALFGWRQMQLKGRNDMHKTIAAALTASALAGCGPDPDMVMQRRQSNSAAPAEVSDSQRVTVERIGVFRDDIAYNDRRGVYLIRDKATGREFIGISGVGISQVGGHVRSTGKSSIIVPDER